MTKPAIENTDQHDTKSESVIPDVTTLRQRVLSLPTLITIIIGATLLGSHYGVFSILTGMKFGQTLKALMYPNTS